MALLYFSVEEEKIVVYFFEKILFKHKDETLKNLLPQNFEFGQKCPLNLNYST